MAGACSSYIAPFSQLFMFQVYAYTDAINAGQSVLTFCVTVNSIPSIIYQLSELMSHLIVAGTKLKLGEHDIFYPDFRPARSSKCM